MITPIEKHGTVTLPDGRQLDIELYLQHDHDTNGADTEEVLLWWSDTGEELDADACNEEIHHGDKVTYLWAWAIDNADWHSEEMSATEPIV